VRDHPHEYRNAATAPALSERWRVSGHVLRKRITVPGATKRDWSDQITIETARACAAAQEEATQARREMREAKETLKASIAS